MAGHINVSLPARAEFLHILRSVVASAAASMDFTFDAIDDLRLVVDEACGQVLSLSTDATALNLSIRFLERSLELVVSTDGSRGPKGEDFEQTMGWTILAALSDSLELQDGANPALRLVKSSRQVS